MEGAGEGLWTEMEVGANREDEGRQSAGLWPNALSLALLSPAQHSPSWGYSKSWLEWRLCLQGGRDDGAAVGLRSPDFCLSHPLGIS